MSKVEKSQKRHEYSLYWYKRLISHFLVNEEMLGKLDVRLIYLTDMLYRRSTYCQSSQKNGALAFPHVILVCTGATENQDFFGSWLKLVLDLNLGRKWSDVLVGWLSIPLVSLANFKSTFLLKKDMGKSLRRIYSSRWREELLSSSF